MREKGPGLIPSPLGEKVLHVGREPLDVAKAQVGAVLADELMRGGVVEVLRGRDLRGICARNVHATLLDKLDEAMQLRRHQEGVHGIAKDDEVRRLERRARLREVPLQGTHAPAHVELGIAVVGMELLEVEHGLQGDAVVSCRRSVDDEDVHGPLLFRNLSAASVAKTYRPLSQATWDEVARHYV